MSAFKVGDVVKWTSQAQGSTRTKVGVVAEVVAAGRLPSRDSFLRLYRGSGVGLPRRSESYVVTVGASEKPYWPLAWKLKPAEPPTANLRGLPITRDELLQMVRILRVHLDGDRYINPLVAYEDEATARKAVAKLLEWAKESA